MLSSKRLDVYKCFIELLALTTKPRKARRFATTSTATFLVDAYDHENDHDHDDAYERLRSRAVRFLLGLRSVVMS